MFVFYQKQVFKITFWKPDFGEREIFSFSLNAKRRIYPSLSRWWAKCVLECIGTEWPVEKRWGSPHLTFLHSAFILTSFLWLLYFFLDIWFKIVFFLLHIRGAKHFFFTIKISFVFKFVFKFFSEMIPLLIPAVLS